MRQRMLAGELYLADAPDLLAARARCLRLLARFNGAPPDADDQRAAILRELLGEVGEGVAVLPTFRCDYGSNIRIGGGTFVNYDTIVLDVAPVVIGAACQLATRVQLLTATHPLDPDIRRAGWESGEPITIGDNVWLGGGVIVCPGVSIGDDTVVGAGAVVTRDLPPGVVAVGSPARVLREITDADRVVPPPVRANAAGDDPPGFRGDDRPGDGPAGGSP
jgi:maltose O-acetyltransferase